jgi:hypothetical protein
MESPEPWADRSPPRAAEKYGFHPWLEWIYRCDEFRVPDWVGRFAVKIKLFRRRALRCVRA